MATRYSIRDDQRGYRADDDDRYGRRGSRYDDRSLEERGLLERAGDEVRSWLGNEEAERRRRRDERAGYRSERDDIRAGDVMTRSVVTVHPLDSIEHAARLMRDFACGALPVVNSDGRLTGMITDRDITMRLVASGADPRHAIVADCMTDQTFACHVNDDLDNCLRRMARHQAQRLPVVNERDQVIGIISQSDLARHAGDHPGRGKRQAVADMLSAVSEPSRSAYR
jgi:CBS-domain-containing membrane protein